MKKGIQTYLLILILALIAGGKVLSQEQPFKVERAAFSSRSYNEYAPVILNNAIVFRADKKVSMGPRAFCAAVTGFDTPVIEGIIG